MDDLSDDGYSQSDEEPFSSSSGGDSSFDDDSDYQDGAGYGGRRAAQPRYREKRDRYQNLLEPSPEEASWTDQTAGGADRVPKPQLLNLLENEDPDSAAAPTLAETETLRRMLVEAHLDAKEDSEGGSGGTQELAKPEPAVDSPAAEGEA